MTLINIKNSILSWYQTISKPQKNWLIGLSHQFVLVINILTIILIFWYFKNLPPKIPLLYSLPWGLDRLVSPIWIFVLPLGSLFWHVINVLSASYATEKYLVFAQILYLSSLLLCILSLIIVTNIISLVL